MQLLGVQSHIQVLGFSEPTLKELANRDSVDLFPWFGNMLAFQACKSEHGVLHFIVASLS